MVTCLTAVWDDLGRTSPRAVVFKLFITTVTAIIIYNIGHGLLHKDTVAPTFPARLVCWLGEPNIRTNYRRANCMPSRPEQPRMPTGQTKGRTDGRTPDRYITLAGKRNSVNDDWCKQQNFDLLSYHITKNHTTRLRVTRTKHTDQLLTS